MHSLETTSSQLPEFLQFPWVFWIINNKQQLLQNWQKKNIMRLNTMNAASEQLSALILYYCNFYKNMLKQQVMNHQQKVQMLRQLLEQNLKKMMYHYQVRRYFISIKWCSFKTNSASKLSTEIGSDDEVTVKSIVVPFWMTCHKLLHVVPDLPVIHHQKLHFQIYQRGIDILIQ